MTASTRAIELADIAAKAADKRLGFDIVALDVSNNMPLTDIFLLVSGRNERMVLSIADEIEDAMRDIGQRTLRREGRREGRWVLLDFNDIVVHVFHEEERTFYGLERLWNDAPVVKLDLGEGDVAAEQPNQAEQS
ncbi:ribosome silencing factor [Pseudoclavibacter sp. Z016]|uniref:ribosome silencing factor n=1 Tax=Pseudoclavibacter sp. Z016 TaxID=2080581 RepID=UPI000CE8DBAC|nr:ribosome silencing factor [Pseudoclavibacter sp. Z016]PPF76761.1 ribosome silencing factor [Pseudoclavibacter sp. Z016]